MKYLFLTLMLCGCAPKYGIYYKDHVPVTLMTSKSDGNEMGMGVMEYGEWETPVAFAWRGDQLWVMYREESHESIGMMSESYHIWPHPVDSGIDAISLYRYPDFQAYKRWIAAGAPRAWEKHLENDEWVETK